MKKVGKVNDKEIVKMHSIKYHKQNRNITENQREQTTHKICQNCSQTYENVQINS